jgi:hypothetical protein
MQVDHISLILRLTVPEAILQRQLHSSPVEIGEQLATVIDQYSRKHKLGYYPAIEFFRQVPEIDQGLIECAEKIAWVVCKLAREEVQSRLRPIFSTVKFQSVQTEAFALPPVRPDHPSSLERLAAHYTPDTVRMELLVSMLRKDNDQRGDAAEAYARKMIYRWLRGIFENVDVTASASAVEQDSIR